MGATFRLSSFSAVAMTAINRCAVGIGPRQPLMVLRLQEVRALQRLQPHNRTTNCLLTR
jgi:hypothetical protein